MEENTQKKPDFVALVGRPNTGEPTLVNYLIGQKTAIMSDKPQTTRNRIQTVYTGEQGRTIFLDIPGIHEVKNKLGEYVVNVAERTLRDMDVVLWLVEPTTLIGTGRRHIAKQLNKTKTPVILAINRIDTVKQQGEVLTFMAAHKDMCRFAEIVPLSTLKDRNTDLLTGLIFKYLPYGPQFYGEDTVTDQSMHQIVPELIRERALRPLSDEILYGIAVIIEKIKERPNGIIGTDASVVCERDSHEGAIIGKGGGMLKRTGTEARKSTKHMMDTWVNLQL